MAQRYRNEGGGHLHHGAKNLVFEKEGTKLGLCAIAQSETGLEMVQSSLSYAFAQLRKTRPDWKRRAWPLRNCAGRGRPGKTRSLVFAQLRKARQTWKDEESGVCAIAQGEADLEKRGVWCLRNCARRGRPGKTRSLVLAQLRKTIRNLQKRGVWCLRNCARRGRPGKTRSLVFAQLRKARQTWKDEESGVCAIAQDNTDLQKRGVWCLRNCARQRLPLLLSEGRTPVF
jgi:hypothetical protein